MKATRVAAVCVAAVILGAGAGAALPNLDAGSHAEAHHAHPAGFVTMVTDQARRLVAECPSGVVAITAEQHPDGNSYSTSCAATTGISPFAPQS